MGVAFVNFHLISRLPSVLYILTGPAVDLFHAEIRDGDSTFRI